MEDGRALEPALKRGIATIRDRTSYLVPLATARLRGAAESTWHRTSTTAKNVAAGVAGFGISFLTTIDRLIGAGLANRQRPQSGKLTSSGALPAKRVSFSS